MWKDATAFIIPFPTASINYGTIVIFPTLIQIYIALVNNRDSLGFSIGLERHKVGDRL